MNARASGRSGGRGLMSALEEMQLSRNERSLYDMISRRPMTIKEIIKRTRLSERMIRTYLDDLIEKSYVRKKAEIAEITKSFRYVYYGNPEDSIADLLIKRIRELQRKRSRHRH